MSYPGEQPPYDPHQPPPGYGYPPPPPPAGAYPGYPGYPGYPTGPGYPPPNHPQSTTAMVLGILGLACCGIASPFALFLGRKSMQEIDASGGQYGGRGQAQAGFIMGIIGTVLWVIGIVVWVVAFGASMSTTTNY